MDDDQRAQSLHRERRGLSPCAYSRVRYTSIQRAWRSESRRLPRTHSSKLLGALDRDAQDLLHAVTFGAQFAHGGVHQMQRVRAQKSAGTARASAAFRGEDPFEQVIGDGAAIHAVATQFAAIVIGQRVRVLAQRLDHFAIANRRPLAAHAFKQLVDELELVERRPLRIGAAPRGIRLEPDRKGFGKVFAGMRLRVPLAEVLHVAAAAGTRSIGIRIRQRGRAEDFAPALAAAQAISRVDGMAGFVTQDAHGAFARCRLRHCASCGARDARDADAPDRTARRCRARRRAKTTLPTSHTCGRKAIWRLSSSR